MAKKVIRLTESQLNKIIKNVLNEQRVSECVVEGDTLCPIICKIKVAKKGCPKSTEVKELQHALASGGFYHGEGGGQSKACATNVEACDGIFDWRTKQAVTEFQRSRIALALDGVVGYNTLTEMQQAGLIKLPQCNCKKPPSITPPSERTGSEITNTDYWYRTIKTSDCETIKQCITTSTKSGKGKEWQSMVDCMMSKNGSNSSLVNDVPFIGGQIKRGCPKTLDCMPKFGGSGKTDERCYDPEFKKKCPNTLVTY